MHRSSSITVTTKTLPQTIYNVNQGFLYIHYNDIEDFDASLTLLSHGEEKSEKLTALTYNFNEKAGDHAIFSIVNHGDRLMFNIAANSRSISFAITASEVVKQLSLVFAMHLSHLLKAAKIGLPTDRKKLADQIESLFKDLNTSITKLFKSIKIEDSLVKLNEAVLNETLQAICTRFYLEAEKLQQINFTPRVVSSPSTPQTLFSPYPDCVRSLEEYTGMELEKLKTYYDTNRKYYDRLEKLKWYIRNHFEIHEKRDPDKRLSEKEVFVLSDQEVNNLMTCQYLVRRGVFSVADVTSFTELDRKFLEDENLHKSFKDSKDSILEKLETFRATQRMSTMNFGRVVS